jgi:hypothetical protein
VAELRLSLRWIALLKGGRLSGRRKKREQNLLFGKALDDIPFRRTAVVLFLQLGDAPKRLLKLLQE